MGGRQPSEIGANYRENVRLVGRDPGAIERQYSEEVQELEMVLRKSRGALAPETVRIMETNLKIIDEAISEAQAAIAADPNSDMLVDLLHQAHVAGQDIGADLVAAERLRGVHRQEGAQRGLRLGGVNHLRITVLAARQAKQIAVWEARPIIGIDR